MCVCACVCLHVVCVRVRRVGQKNRTVSPMSLGIGSPHFFGARRRAAGMRTITLNLDRPQIKVQRPTCLNFDLEWKCR